MKRENRRLQTELTALKTAQQAMHADMLQRFKSIADGTDGDGRPQTVAVDDDEPHSNASIVLNAQSIAHLFGLSELPASLRHGLCSLAHYCNAFTSTAELSLSDDIGIAQRTPMTIKLSVSQHAKATIPAHYHHTGKDYEMPLNFNTLLEALLPIESKTKGLLLKNRLACNCESMPFVMHLEALKSGDADVGSRPETPAVPVKAEDFHQFKRGQPTGRLATRFFELELSKATGKAIDSHAAIRQDHSVLVFSGSGALETINSPVSLTVRFAKFATNRNYKLKGQPKDLRFRFAVRLGVDTSKWNAFWHDASNGTFVPTVPTVYSPTFNLKTLGSHQASGTTVAQKRSKKQQSEARIAAMTMDQLTSIASAPLIAPSSADGIRAKAFKKQRVSSRVDGGDAAAAQTLAQAAAAAAAVAATTIV